MEILCAVPRGGDVTFVVGSHVSGAVTQMKPYTASVLNFMSEEADSGMCVCIQ
jgi:hypothetical protein